MKKKTERKKRKMEGSMLEDSIVPWVSHLGILRILVAGEW